MDGIAMGEWQDMVDDEIKSLRSAIISFDVKLSVLNNDIKKLKTDYEMSPRETFFTRTIQTVYEITTKGMRYYFLAHMAKIAMFLIGVYIVVKAI
jgi:hypothetical protein